MSCRQVKRRRVELGLWYIYIYNSFSLCTCQPQNLKRKSTFLLPYQGPMAVDDDPNNSNTVVKCICSDKKVVEVDRKTWELFNKMVPKEGFHRIREPVEMYFVRSTAFKKILTYCVRISDGTYSERWMYDELLHSESLIGLFHLVGTADFLNFESLDAFILHYVEDKSEEEISYMVRNEELKSLLKIIKVFFIFFYFLIQIMCV